MNDHLQRFLQRVERREATVAVVGLGYVGLPLAIAFADAGFRVLGLDIDGEKVSKLSAGETYLRHIKAECWMPHITSKRFHASTNFADVREADAMIVCVPTPLTKNREPDTSYIENTARVLAGSLHAGQLYSLESTTYPGTTDDLVRPMLEKATGLVAGKDFFLSFSPEREDPGNPTYHTSTIPKVVGGVTPACLKAAVALYSAAVENVVPVKSARTAELTKVFENTFRSVNIALVNELKVLCHRMGIDVWEVIDAAATKPFGFMPFYPGPGIGGHCIPIDPFYLTWKAREYDLSTRFIELAGEINASMPYYVVERTQEGLNRHQRALNGAEVLVLGVAYKKGIDDMRESPALRVIELLCEKGAKVLYHDPLIPALPKTREYKFDMRSEALTPDLVKRVACVIVLTDHPTVDYQMVVKNAQVVIDTRHVLDARQHSNVIEA